MHKPEPELLDLLNLPLENLHHLWGRKSNIEKCLWAETGSHLLQAMFPSTQNILIPGICPTHPTSGSKGGRGCHPQSPWSLHGVSRSSSGAQEPEQPCRNIWLCPALLPAREALRAPGSCCCSQSVFLLVAVVAHRFAPCPALLLQPPLAAVGAWGLPGGAATGSR